MKAISIRQPWPSIILTGAKCIENRSSRTHYRGWILIHAAQRLDLTSASWLRQKSKDQTIGPIDFATLKTAYCIAERMDSFQRGGIVGAMHIVDCVTSSDSPFWRGPFGYVLDRVIPLPFYPCRGYLGIFNVDLPAEIQALIPAV